MIDSWDLAMRAARRSARTRATYTDAARWLAGSLPAGTDWDHVARDVVYLRTFFATLADAGYSAGYVNNIGRCLQQYFKWLSIEEDLPTPFGPRLAVPAPPKPGQKLPPVLATDQLAALIRSAESGRVFEDRRDAAILRMFVCTGCRLAELAGIRLADVDLARLEVTVTGKGDKVRIVRLDDTAARAIDRYLRVRAKHKHAAAARAFWLRVRGPGGLTPNGLYQLVTRRASRLGIDLHPHLFRHTFSHRWLDAGGGEGDLMELMGWDSPQMLRHYGRSARGARARRAYDRVDVMRGI
jgi:integrase/recombinase XerD